MRPMKLYFRINCNPWRHERPWRPPSLPRKADQYAAHPLDRTAPQTEITAHYDLGRTIERSSCAEPHLVGCLRWAVSPKFVSIHWASEMWRQTLLEWYIRRHQGRWPGKWAEPIAKFTNAYRRLTGPWIMLDLAGWYFQGRTFWTSSLCLGPTSQWRV